MFRKILYWVRVDNSSLGRPQLPGNQPMATLAVPMCILSLVHEMEDLKPNSLDMEEVRKWAVAKIQLHVHRNGTRTVSYTHLTLPTIYSV